MKPCKPASRNSKIVIYFVPCTDNREHIQEKFYIKYFKSKYTSF